VSPDDRALLAARDGSDLLRGGKYARWLEVELAVCEVHAERGLIPPASLAAIRAKAAVDPARVAEIEERVRHDVIAFTTALAEKIGPDSRYVHYGLTSSDVLDTALALQIRDAGCCSLRAWSACAACWCGARASSSTRRASAAPTACTPSRPRSA
jgi:adenylosuccinate lyase